MLFSPLPLASFCILDRNQPRYWSDFWQVFAGHVSQQIQAVEAGADKSKHTSAAFATSFDNYTIHVQVSSTTVQGVFLRFLHRCPSAWQVPSARSTAVSAADVCQDRISRIFETERCADPLACQQRYLSCKTHLLFFVLSFFILIVHRIGFRRLHIFRRPRQDRVKGSV